MTAFREILSSLLTPAFSDLQWLQLERHYELFLKWNAVMNLSAIREPREAIERHFAESLFVAPLIPAGVRTVVDVGSGGGFPGLPVAVARPELSMTLLDSHARKSVFLREVARSVPNVRVQNERLESWREHYDLVLSRGVSWAHMRKFVLHLSKRVFLMTTTEDLPSVQASSGWDWDAPTLLPYGEHRILLSGRFSG
jgi:16S rRNA (guanine527-N7)-methyltransferase